MWYVRSIRTLVMVMAVSSTLPLASYSNTLSALPPSSNVSSGVKSFNEWKKSKIIETENKIRVLRDKLTQIPMREISSKDISQRAKTEAGLNHELQNQLDQELLNLSVSRDLTISDYFVGYLTRQTHLDSAIRDVSGRLTPDEVADLMTAYAEHLIQSLPSAPKGAPKID